MKTGFDTDVLFNLCCHTFHVLSATFIKYGQNVNKHDISEKAIFLKMGKVYVNFVPDITKEHDM